MQHAYHRLFEASALALARAHRRQLQLTRWRTLLVRISEKSHKSTKVIEISIPEGLTQNCVKSNEAKNVPGTGKEYKVPEYFGFNRMSYHEAEVEMQNFRIQQPVAPRK